jgi:hypothetical protein
LRSGEPNEWATDDFGWSLKMKTIASVQPEAASLPEGSRGTERAPQQPIAALRSAFQTELSGVIDRLMTQATAEADAVRERTRAAGQIALEAAQAALEQQTRRNDALSESLLQSEIQVEELRVKLQAECEHANAAKEAHQTEQSARARAEAAIDEAQTIREQIVSSYDSRLQAMQAELGAMRTESIGLKQQLEVAASERARLIAALRTVQQACASAQPGADIPETRVPMEKTADDGGPMHDFTRAAMQSRDDGTAPPAAPAVDRRLKLVASSEVAPIAAPPHLVEYFNELFDQIEAMYRVDERAHASVEVVDLLSANLRCAREVFVQRASSAGCNGATLFDQKLSAKLDEVGATSLGRHLAIAAYEVTQAREAHIRSEAS